MIRHLTVQISFPSSRFIDWLSIKLKYRGKKFLQTNFLQKKK